MLVIGRPIRRARYPKRAATLILVEISSAMKSLWGGPAIGPHRPHNPIAHYSIKWNFRDTFIMTILYIVF
jgi:hypothetical protein